MGNVKGRGVTEDEKLDDRRSDHHETALRITQDSDEFLDDQGKDAAQDGHCFYSSRLVSLRRTTTKKNNRHQGQRQGRGPEDGADVTGQKEGVADFHEIAGRNEMADNPDRLRSTFQIEKQTGEEKGRQKAGNHRNLGRHELHPHGGRDGQAKTQGGQHEYGAEQNQKGQRTL